ncbi:hypothetical protein GUITHDRAFT_134323 [Guillardia theta CCMP2712]|uniref:BZIP domain-containing protein n=2 Tax=Guillardia theta TaxID=55529 RepID=L1JSG2_GUITC|nr:hypothetical protein GUITHDRAFT_134323 [Guillardia theta CCMP2712]EKX51377.1 hypothetical protein GUITHDRAFT_134323 [Guillardia theta CCMP2712]|eukprot:XP_005838357.1 hypothetical protein GUITHDRAFT_134323 [Guillardia theta CCMP2712]
MASALWLVLLRHVLWVHQAATHGTEIAESRGLYFSLASCLTCQANMMPPLAKLRGSGPSKGFSNKRRLKLSADKRKQKARVIANNNEQKKAQLEVERVRVELGKLQAKIIASNNEQEKAQLEIERVRVELEYIQARIIASNNEQEKTELRAQEAAKKAELQELKLNLQKHSMRHEEISQYFSSDGGKQSRSLLGFM